VETIPEILVETVGRVRKTFGTENPSKEIACSALNRSNNQTTTLKTITGTIGARFFIA
jgi:hypothetical protein